MHPCNVCMMCVCVYACVQLASAAALMDFRLQVWDIEKPFVPLASCLGHRDAVTGFAWYVARRSSIRSGC
jgi:hypothetical protein